jgi:hypothetical protein
MLRYFSERDGFAQKAYLAFVNEPCALGIQPEQIGGWLIRSAGRWS